MIVHNVLKFLKDAKLRIKKSGTLPKYLHIVFFFFFGTMFLIYNIVK
jgi:hypothetical protein